MSNYGCLSLGNIQRPDLNVPNKEDNLQLKVTSVNQDIKKAGKITLKSMRRIYVQSSTTERLFT